MMKFKKFLAAAMTGAMMFGMVATAAPVASVIAADATATEPSKYKFEVNYDSFSAYIYTVEEADPYVTLEVCKDENGAKEGTKYTYEDNDGVWVDLSFLKASKPSYIRVYGSSEKREASPVYPVNAQGKKVSMKYTAGKDLDNERWAAYSGKDVSIKSENDLKLYEYRTLYGSDFESLYYLDQKTTEVAGTTIVVRKAAVLSGSAVDLAPASAEAKVKIPAAPKAPKVTIDYAKGTVKLPKNVKIQVIPVVTGGAITAPSGWAESKNGGAMEPKEILNLLKEDTIVKGNETSMITNGFTLVVRTLPGKKAESNPAIVLIDGADPLVATANGAALGTSTISWKEATKKTTAGFELTVTGNFEYLKGEKWTKLKDKFFTTEKSLTVRVAGDKSGKKLPSQAYPMEMTVAELKVTPTTSEITNEGLSLSAFTVTLGDKAPTDKIEWSIDGDVFEIANDKISVKSGATYKTGTYTLTAKVDGKEAKVTLTAK